MDCWTWTASFSPPSPGPARGGRGEGQATGAGPLFCLTLAAVSGPGPGMAGGVVDCWTWTASFSPLSSGPARGWQGEDRTAGPGLLSCLALTAVSGPGLGRAWGVADHWTWKALLRPPRAREAYPCPSRRPPPHPTKHPLTTPPPSLCTSLCTFIIIPPAAIVKPQGFLVRGFPPRRAAGVHSHLTLSHASHHPTNLSDSPLAGKGTCCLFPLAQETPSVLPRCSVLPSPPPAASPRCWSLPDVSYSDVRVGVPFRCCRRGGRGLSDRTTILLPPKSLHTLTPLALHTTHTRTPPHSRTSAHSREAKLCSTMVSSLPHLIL